MNIAVKCAIRSPIASRVAPFHSTPVSERRRRNAWDSGCSRYAKTGRRMEAKRTLLRNVSAYAEWLFKSWKTDDVDDNWPLNRGPSWFRKDCSGKGTRTSPDGSEESQWDQYRNRGKGRKKFYSSEDEDIETIFRSAFGGPRVCYWSFSSGGNFHWRGSWTEYSRFRAEEEHNHSSREYKRTTISDLSSDRVALGLSATGPLKLEEVKNAYRACALKWHPDRHQGPAKAVAEEKFKHCSAAYQSLCDELAAV